MTRPDLSHDHLEELIVADVLGGLEAAERDDLTRELASHGPGCEACRRLLTEYTEVAASLATSLEPSPMSPRAEESLREAMRRQPAGPSVAVARAPDVERRWDRERRAQPAVRRVQRWIAAGSVAAALAAVAGAIGYSLAPQPPAPQRSFLAFVTEPGTRVVSLEGRTGRVAVAYRPDSTDAWVLATGLTDPPSGMTYELWYLPEGSDRIRPAGTFEPADGTVVAPTTVGAPFRLLAVSVEPDGGSDQPTTRPVFVTQS